ncbi:unnamed protein product [Owenia fusiformis]|uniref:DUF7164 domain-containing protein n=1 Tax=Owenia fusiformis TaxID=6347 RepID=A0A8J1UKR9_OWEFU|nr:unnamed protein product [Owenia fusiformis]
MLCNFKKKIGKMLNKTIIWIYILFGFVGLSLLCNWSLYVTVRNRTLVQRGIDTEIAETKNTRLMQLNNISVKGENRMEDTVNGSLRNGQTVSKNGHKSTTLLHNAFLMYLDQGDGHMVQFTLFLYASWKYVMSHRYLKSNVTIDNTTSLPDIIFDLVVYCHPESCKLLPLDCIPIEHGNVLEAVPRCWYIPSGRLQNHPDYPSNYGYINTFTFLLDDNLGQIANRYDRILRTDTDVFISPAILGWPVKYPFVTGRGGYGVPFSENRLREISAKLGLRHQHISNIGSSWYAEPGIFLKAAKLALKLSVHFYNNEFNKSLPGLEGVFNKTTDGEWPKWWRGVSTMYGSELAVNHLIPNLTQDHIAFRYMDKESTDGVTPVMKAPHIHCWHTDIEFNKFVFTDKLVRFIRTDIKKLWMQNETMLYFGDLDVSGMTIRQYVTYIAWNGVLKYVPHMFEKMMAH